jgi:hypothetical protein
LVKGQSKSFLKALIATDDESVIRELLRLFNIGTKEKFSGNFIFFVVVSDMSDRRNTGQCGILLLEEPEEKFRFRYKAGKDIFLTPFNFLIRNFYIMTKILFESNSHCFKAITKLTASGGKEPLLLHPLYTTVGERELLSLKVCLIL